MLRAIHTLSLAAFAMAMCKKESVRVSPVPATPAPDTELSRGLPENPKSIHGYFFSAYNYRPDNYNGSYTTASCYAQFSDPASNLLASYDRDNQSSYVAIRSNSNVDMG